MAVLIIIIFLTIRVPLQFDGDILLDLRQIHCLHSVTAAQSNDYLHNEVAINYARGSRVDHITQPSFVFCLQFGAYWCSTEREKWEYIIHYWGREKRTNNLLLTWLPCDAQSSADIGLKKKSQKNKKRKRRRENSFSCFATLDAVIIHRWLESRPSTKKNKATNKNEWKRTRK